MKILAVLLCLVASACSEPKPPATEVPDYQTLHLPDTKGAFFHFDHNGTLYLACTLHQGSIAPSTQLTRNGSTDTLSTGKQIHRQKDLQVFKFDSDTITTAQALPYQKNPKLKPNDPVVILNRGQKISGIVVQEPSAKDHHYYLKTDKPFPADGMSGSPVFSKRLGTVIGVLETANDKTKATLCGFELLLMP